jgi:hypothetical protein
LEVIGTEDLSLILEMLDRYVTRSLAQANHIIAEKTVLPIFKE